MKLVIIGAGFAGIRGTGSEAKAAHCVACNEEPFSSPAADVM